MVAVLESERFESGSPFFNKLLGGRRELCLNKKAGGQGAETLALSAELRNPAALFERNFRAHNGIQRRSVAVPGAG